MVDSFGKLPINKIPVSEADLASFVEDCLDTFGWKWEHPRPARIRIKGQETYRTATKGHKGRPDYFCVRPPRIVIMEIKSEKGKLSPEQAEWISLLEQCQKSFLLEPLELKQGRASVAIKEGQKILTLPEVYVFYPKDSQKIAEVLR